MKKFKFFAFFAVCAFVPVFVSCQNKKFNLSVEEIEILTSAGNSVFVKAEIAQKEEERNYGFMNRKNIPEGTGMLFVFEKDQVLSFWMKNTPHPLSIAYIDRSGKIQNIFDMTPFSLAPVKSTRSVRYALEVPQGWFEKTGIKTGDKIVLD
ncbi:DUF192 domain-containing protein [uncultured Treponema sp.]|uniref:DUF192 domain-containing protein n=1 Tax=uncultured Treponema sp. TaxID=162155 RepID=UPI0025854B69|nr:DUF192 domain-containing protein [uncultured Treponema sp.]